MAVSLLLNDIYEYGTRLAELRTKHFECFDVQDEQKSDISEKYFNPVIAANLTS